MKRPKQRQIDRVYKVMSIGRYWGANCWWTLSAIAATSQSLFGKTDSEAAISARLRDLRADGYIVDYRRVAPGRSQREYRLRSKP